MSGFVFPFEIISQVLEELSYLRGVEEPQDWQYNIVPSLLVSSMSALILSDACGSGCSEPEIYDQT